MAESKPLILIIEDEEDMLLGVQHNLEFEGYRTLTATDGRGWSIQQNIGHLIDLEYLPEQRV